MAAKKGSRSRSAPSRHRGLGFLFWICLAAIAVAVGVAAQKPLKAAFSQLGGKPPAAAPAQQAPKVTVAPLTDGEQRQKDRPGAPAAPAAPADRRPQANPAEKTQPIPPERPAIRKARLYFASVDKAGKIQLKSVIRPIPSSDSPLRDTLEALLKGPSSQEMNLGLVSMIPTGARVRNVTVSGDTAVVDFTESFRFNPQGLEAMDAQLRQVVYAATEFPLVKNVQIRIEGATVRYLGTEGMRLDAPLSRSSFPN
jgi:spore germination protein GerM